jgi:hypothetical protein
MILQQIQERPVDAPIKPRKGCLYILILAKFCRNAIARDAEPPDVILYTDQPLQSSPFLFCIYTPCSSSFNEYFESRMIGIDPKRIIDDVGSLLHLIDAYRNL